MNYPENIGEKLGFIQIQNHIKSLCLSNMGAEYADKMKFSNRFTLVNQWVQQVSEMKQLMAGYKEQAS